MKASTRQFSSRWFRVYDESIDDPKIQMLSDRLHRFLFNCWCLASKHGGYLPPVAEIAWRLRKTTTTVASMVAELHEAGFLDPQGDTFEPHNWPARQYHSDTSTQRVREFRERKRNVPETFHETDGETVVAVSETPSEQNRTEQNRTECRDPEIIPPPKNGGGPLLLENPQVNGSTPKKRKPRKSDRTISEIREALGPNRLPWWEAFWKVYPCHGGTNEAMDAYERRILTREAAVQVYNGAKRYALFVAEKLKSDPGFTPKYGQGWINKERYIDNLSPIEPEPMPPPKPIKTVPYDPMALWKAQKLAEQQQEEDQLEVKVQ